MSQTYPSRSLNVLMLLTLVCVVSCSSPGVPHETGATQGQQAPFQSQIAEPANNREGEPVSAAEDGSAGEHNLPFHDSQALPAGTLIAVRLKSAIFAEGRGQHGGFKAIVDETVAIEGSTLIPSGTTVSGRVQSARTSEVKPGRGYVRLTLESINISGSDIPIRTASLFARQSSVRDVSTSAIGVEKGRRLVFRLVEPANLSTNRTHAKR